MSGSEGFNNEIKNIRHDLMLNEYPKEFVDSIMKQPSSNRPFSYTTYESRIIIPYVKGIYEKLRHTGNVFYVRIIFKIKRYTPRDIDENWTG
jgi:hypothetical protein